MVHWVFISLLVNTASVSAKRNILKKINGSLSVHFSLGKYIFGLSQENILKKINGSFSVHFSLGKYSFGLNQEEYFKEN